MTDDHKVHIAAGKSMISLLWPTAWPCFECALIRTTAYILSMNPSLVIVDPEDHFSLATSMIRFTDDYSLKQVADPKPHETACSESCPAAHLYESAVTGAARREAKRRDLLQSGDLWTNMEQIVWDSECVCTLDHDKTLHISLTTDLQPVAASIALFEGNTRRSFQDIRHEAIEQIYQDTPPLNEAQMLRAIDIFSPFVEHIDTAAAEIFAQYLHAYFQPRLVREIELRLQLLGFDDRPCVEED